MSFIFNPMKMGLAGLYMPKFDVDHWFDVVEQRPADDDLPRARDGRAASPRARASTTPTCRAPMAVSIGSAPLAPATLKKLQDKMPQASVINSYGLTEAGPAFITMPKEESRQAHRLGRQADAADGGEGRRSRHRRRAARPTTSASCSCGCPGKRREYYKDDGATAATWTDDGWLRTGDLAYLDEDGFVYISGRIKDMIIRGGNNIYATDVEAVILEHPAVQEAAVDRRAAHTCSARTSARSSCASPARRSTDDDAARVLRRAPRRLQAPAPCCGSSPSSPATRPARS